MVDVAQEMQDSRTRQWQHVVQRYAEKSQYDTAIDIGSGNGLSAYSIAVSGNGGIISVDPEYSGSVETMARNNGYIDRLDYINKTSKEFFGQATRMYAFDFACIDGSKDYEDVFYDLENCWSTLRDGGYVVCNDYGTFEQVKKAVEMFANSNDLDFTTDNDKAVFHNA